MVVIPNRIIKDDRLIITFPQSMVIFKPLQPITIQCSDDANQNLPCETDINNRSKLIVVLNRDLISGDTLSIYVKGAVNPEWSASAVPFVLRF
jgi:hypothetical protein